MQFQPELRKPLSKVDQEAYSRPGNIISGLGASQ
jgi:hypothetical protein